VNHRTVREFWEHYDELPTEIQRLADKNFALLKSDGAHPSLRFKPVGQLWSARVGIHYRALARLRGGEYHWFWIGHHSEYDRYLDS
jgi:hypothetical protein